MNRLLLALLLIVSGAFFVGWAVHIPERIGQALARWDAWVYRDSADPTPGEIQRALKRHREREARRAINPDAR
jgi:hypothetical protein